jgi:hypothetical protein
MGGDRAVLFGIGENIGLEQNAFALYSRHTAQQTRFFYGSIDQYGVIAFTTDNGDRAHAVLLIKQI